MKLLILIIFWLCACAPSWSLDNGVGLTPPMGWNSWKLYGCSVSERLIKNVADLFIQLHLIEKGYQYIIIGDCWQSHRDNLTNKLVEDSEKFPSGIKSLARYLHQKNLKIGLYSDAAAFTCSQKPGSLNYESIDAQVFADWEIDYLFYDNCFQPSVDPLSSFLAMRDALNSTGRPIYYHVNDGNSLLFLQSGKGIANSWGTTSYALYDDWQTLMDVIDNNSIYYNMAGVSGWNDPGLLLAGGFPSDQQMMSQVQFASWAMMKSPLILSEDLSQLTPIILSIISNQDVISVNQDKLGAQGRKFLSNRYHRTEIWTMDLLDHSMAILLLNRNSGAEQVTVDFGQIGFPFRTAEVRDMVQKRSLGIFVASFTWNLAPRSVQLVKLLKASSDL